MNTFKSKRAVCLFCITQNSSKTNIYLIKRDVSKTLQNCKFKFVTCKIVKFLSLSLSHYETFPLQKVLYLFIYFASFASCQTELVLDTLVSKYLLLHVRIFIHDVVYFAMAVKICLCSRNLALVNGKTHKQTQQNFLFVNRVGFPFESFLPISGTKERKIIENLVEFK